MQKPQTSNQPQPQTIQQAIIIQQSSSQVLPINEYIILQDNRGQQRLLKLSAHRKFNWRKTQINLEHLKKHYFYELLEVGNNSLKQIEFENPDEQQQQSENQEEQQNDNDKEIEVNEDAEVQGCSNNGNNKRIKQNSSNDIDGSNKEMYILQDAQKLQTQDIQKLKKELKPEQVISSIVQNNQQFEKRTIYSKAKYLKKKQRKYIFNFYAKPVCLESLHNYFYKNEPKIVGGIRWDMLGLMLLYGGPYRKVLVGQRAKGILLGSLLIRGATQVTLATFDQGKTIKAFPVVDQLNIPPTTVKEKVNFTSWKRLLEQQQYVQKHQQHFDNFILLGNYDFKAILLSVQEKGLLNSNCVICFYCQSMEPLLECYDKMRKDIKHFLNVKMYDSWCREFQVLKNRTHPLMSMDSRSGFILTAIRGSAEIAVTE